MKNKKLHDLMTVLYNRVGHKSDLSKARFTKLVYLVDWKMCQKHKESISNIKWVFNHYGPYVDDVVKEAVDSLDFEVVSTKNAYGSLKEWIHYSGNQSQTNTLTKNELSVIDEVVEETDSMYFNKFIDHVYSTYPVENSNRYSSLNLPILARKEAMENKSLKSISSGGQHFPEAVLT